MSSNLKSSVRPWLGGLVQVPYSLCTARLEQFHFGGDDRKGVHSQGVGVS